jgi:hypothetical protein
MEGRMIGAANCGCNGNGGYYRAAQFTPTPIRMAPAYSNAVTLPAMVRSGCGCSQNANQFSTLPMPITPVMPVLPSCQTTCTTVSSCSKCGCSPCHCGGCGGNYGYGNSCGGNYGYAGSYANNCYVIPQPLSLPAGFVPIG